MVAELGESTDAAATAASAVVMSGASRLLRRSLTPLEWVVLEDVARDANDDGDGRLLAATSARQLAENLGVSPGSADKALVRLRSLGLVAHDRQPGPAGRFGLSIYRLVPPASIEVVGTRGSTPARTCTDAPRADAPGAVWPRAAEGPWRPRSDPVPRLRSLRGRRAPYAGPGAFRTTSSSTCSPLPAIDPTLDQHLRHS